MQGHCFFREVLSNLNWFYRRIKSEGGFSGSWYLFEIEFVMEGMKSLFVSVPKGKKNTVTRKTVPGLIWVVEIFVVNVIKFITLYMNPWLTNITLSCRIFIINIYMANFAVVDYIINIIEIHINVDTGKKMFR